MGNQIFLFSALLQEFYVTTQAFLLLMHSQSYLLCIARYPSYMNVHFQQLHRTTAEIIFRYGNISFRTTAEIIFRHGNISFFLFLVKKPLKQTNKQTKKPKPRFGCKIFGNSLTFLTECFCVHSKVSSKSPKLLFKGNLESKLTDRLSIDSFMYELPYDPLSLWQAAIWYTNTIEKGLVWSLAEKRTWAT